MGEGDSDEVPSEQLQENVCTEARLSLNQQLNRIEQYDRKAVELFRSNILLAGVLLSGLTIVVRTDGVDPIDFFNVWSVIGAFSLGASTLLCAMAYTSSSYDMGITSKTISKVESGEYDDNGDFNENLRGLYKGWLDHNRNTGVFNSYLITGAIIFLMDSIVFFIGSVAVVLSPELQAFSELLFGISLILIILSNVAVYYAEYLYMKIYPESNQ
ncbi:hypothetical protein BJ1_gp17 [Halorubrum virus BJ1]|uniref:Uncharacterized protein n=1 Tax=Halorubrum virus BJ1 TaxID=416419 RepID=A0ZYN0_9CAUD|nr:hypothetical protein BJ1_gp17 [Halorubrum virus BJ1]CAL92439.1 hypothetical protein [Halorubrum virus BJ1]